MQNLIHFLTRLYLLLKKKATNPMSRFTDMELAIAKSVDLVSVASHMGYTPKKIGKY